MSVLQSLLLGVVLGAPLLLRIPWSVVTRPAPVFPDGDGALLELSVLRAEKGQELLGPYSRFEWHHPGPLYFYLQLPFYWLFHRQYSALKIGAVVIATASVAGSMAIAGRFGGVGMLSWTFVVLTALHSLYGWFIGSPWNPYVTVLPCMLLLFSGTALATGSGWSLPLVALVSSLLVQTHVGYFSTVVAVSAASLGSYAWVSRARRHRKGNPQPWLPIEVAAILLVILWIPTAVDQTFGGSANLGRLLEFARSHRGDHSLSESIAVVCANLGVFAIEPIRGWLSFGLRGRVAEPVGLVLTLVLPAMAWWGARTGAPFASALCALCFVAVVSAIWWVRRITGPVEPHLVLWIPAISLAALSAVGGVILNAIECTRSRSSRGRMVRGGLIATLSLAMFVIRIHQEWTAHSIAGPGSAHVAALSKELEAYLRREPSYHPLLNFRGRVWPVAAGVVLQCRKAGILLAVEPQWGFMFGEELVASGAEDVVVTVARRGEVPNVDGIEFIGSSGGFVMYAVRDARSSRGRLLGRHYSAIRPRRMRSASARLRVPTTTPRNVARRAATASASRPPSQSSALAGRAR